MKNIYGSWNPVRGEQDFTQRIQQIANAPSQEMKIHLAAPLSLISHKNKTSLPEISLGVDLAWSMAPGSYNEKVGPSMLAKMELPFVFVDSAEIALSSSEPFQEIQFLTKAFISHSIPVVIRLSTTIAALLGKRMEREWIDQCRTIFEDLPIDAWQHVTLSCPHPHHNYYGSKVLLKKLNESYQTIRAGLNEAFGPQTAAMQLITELPLQSSQKDVARKSLFEGVYFPKISLYPDLFVEFFSV